MARIRGQNSEPSQSIVLAIIRQHIAYMSAYLRWSDLMNLLLHTGQMKFFSPVWVRMWRASSSDRANFLRQPSQVQGKGRSPAGDTVRY